MASQEGGTEAAPLVVDSEQDDTDSALGDSVAGSFTMSLTSSVLNYQYENGRRYHAYREGAYIMPNDEPEQQRLDILHHIFRMILGGPLHCCPLTEEGPPTRVLDLGTGTGIWAIDFADEYPSSIVIGIDLSPIQPTWVPPNCKFYVDDMESRWPYPREEHFDYIHGRGLCGSLADWKKLFRQAFENLKPGGWFEMQEFLTQVQSDDGTLELTQHLCQWLDELNEASERLGKPLRTAHLIKPWMEEAGFVDVEEKVVKVPIGPWAKDKKHKLLGIFYQASFLDTVEPATLALFTRVLGYSIEQANIVIANVKKDLRNDAAHIWVVVHYVWGKRI